LTPLNPRSEDLLQHGHTAFDREESMKILLPVDGSDYTKRMLSYIAAHDELLGSGHEYLVFTVVAPIPAYAARFLDRGTLDSHYGDQAEHVFKTVRAFAGQQGWRVQLSHAHGDAAASIAAFAEAQSPDLIVMGTHGHSALGNVVLGSVATGVLARSRAPVLLIR
jgi:nucleotide-binding universal stress UspA family protein